MGMDRRWSSYISLGVFMSSSARAARGPGFATYIVISAIGIVTALVIGIASKDLVWTLGLLALSIAMMVYAFRTRRASQPSTAPAPDGDDHTS